MIRQVRPSAYLETARARLALLRAALVGLGHEPDPVALSAAIGAIEDLQALVEEGLGLALEQDTALDNLARSVAGDAARTAAVALSVLPAGSETVN